MFQSFIVGEVEHLFEEVDPEDGLHRPVGTAVVHAVHGSKALLVNQGERLVSENLGPTSLQALSLLRRHQELGLPEASLAGLVFGTSSPPSARRSAHDLLLHYPHLAPGWRGVFTNKSSLDGTDFSGATFFKTSLSRGSGDLPNFSNFLIANSNFKDACWTRPNFREVRIAACDFTNASLKDADLSGANFSTDLSARAAQSQECGITQRQLDEARSEPTKPPILNGSS